MSHLPAQLTESIKDISGFNKEAFEKVHASGEQITSIRINPNKFSIENLKLSGELCEKIEMRVPWSETGYYLGSRPSFTFDPLFHAGCYYVQEASSMFLEQALKQTVDLSRPVKVLDLCAAPGGKSTHIQSLISKDSLLVSNEVIKSRSNILKDNIIKWGCENAVVTNNDPRDFGKLSNYFDVIIVDAPCSGSGLFRKEPDAVEYWSENNVTLCSQRQQRILADVYPALKEGGILIYSTCSYSMEEDENIVEWLAGQFQIENFKLKIKDDWNIVESNKGYRFWPDKVKGEGFFISVFRKPEGEEDANYRIGKKMDEISKKEIEFVRRWCKNSEVLSFIKAFVGIYAIDKCFLADINLLNSNLRVNYFGVKMGGLVRDKLIPDHALAMSLLIPESFPRIALSHDEAIRYLQKKEITVEKNTRGWQLVYYQNHPLGWVNVLPNRINNYYPKELRILKDI